MASPNRPLSRSTLAALNDWVRDEGPQPVASAMGLCVATLTRVNAGLPASPMTARAIERSLGSRRASNDSLPPSAEVA